MSTRVDRVAELAATVRPLRLFLSALAAPFYVLGFVLGLLLVAARWMVAAVQVGMSDARKDEHGTG